MKAIFASSLIAAMLVGIASSAFAQASTEAPAIPDSDMSAVKSHCLMLQSEGDAGNASGPMSAGKTDQVPADSDNMNLPFDDRPGSASGPSSDNVAGSPADSEKNATTALNVDAMTLDDCKAAGVID